MKTRKQLDFRHYIELTSTEREGGGGGGGRRLEEREKDKIRHILEKYISIQKGGREKKDMAT